MLATFMEVLDASVANVSLPHIAGNLSATTEEATWVLTSYLVSNAIVLPASAWLGRLFGRKRFLLGCIIIFTFASVLCGLAPSLGWLITARVVQGIGGGALQPIAQAVLLESFPAHKRGMAMGVFALGVIVAPIVGPTLGGFITDNYSWRWIFLINLPVGITSWLMVRAYLHDPAHARKRRGSPVDYWGLGGLVVWLGLMQITLDKGQQEDWFASWWITIAALVSFIAFVGLIVRELSTAHPIVNVRVLKNRNFAIGVVLMTVTGAMLYGSTVMLPIYLQSLMGYTAMLSGMALSPRGIGSFCTALVIGRIVGKVDPRWLIAMGFSLLACSNWWLSHINLDLAYRNIALPVILNGVAISFIFVPLTTLTMATLTHEEIGGATGIYNLMRNLGGSLGIALLITLVARWTQVHQAGLVAHLSSYSPIYQQREFFLQHFFAPHVGDAMSGAATRGALYRELARHARVLSFIDGFHWMTLLTLLCAPLALFFKRPTNTATASAVGAH